MTTPNLNTGHHGKSVLLSLVSNSKSEYEQLTEEDREELVRLYQESKSAESTAKRLNVTSRINGITATLKAIENEVIRIFSPLVFFFSIRYSFFQLANLKSRSGVEVLLHVTKGTTDLPIRGYSFATEGVSEILERVFKIDTQHFLTMMEGFAIQGLRGEQAHSFRTRA